MHSSDDDERAHRGKRRRVSKACDRCRQGKLKCNGARPQCDTCLKADKPCSYGIEIRRRGLRTGYVRALECLWGLILQSIDGSEDAIEKLITTTSKQSFWARDDVRDGLGPGESPWEAWKSSKIPQAIDSLLSVQDNGEDEVPSTMPMYLSAQIEPLRPLRSLSSQSSILRRRSHVEPEMNCPRCSSGMQEQTAEPRDSVTRQNHSQVQNHKAPETSACLRQTPPGAIPKVPPNPVQLLSRYFSLTHTWLPIVERHAVYRIFFAHNKTSGSFGTKKQDSGDAAVLWAIFAFASRTGHQNNLALQPSAHPDELYIVARRAIPLETEDNYSPGHVQAYLILGLLHYSSCEWDIARVLVGQATLIGSRIGLDQPDSCQTDYHRRTWLGCFVLDTLLSVHTGKTPWIRSDQVKTLLPIDETGNEEWEPWHLQHALRPNVGTEMAEFAAPTYTLSVFAKLLDLLCIANDSICATTPEQKDGCKEALTAWKEHLPEHIKGFGGETSQEASAPPSPNMLNLHILYSFVRARLAHPTPAHRSMTEVRGHEWPKLLQDMEAFFGRFDPQAIPPSFHLLGSSSRPTTGHDSIWDFLAELKNPADAGLPDRSLSDRGVGISTEKEPPPNSSNLINIPTNAIPYNQNSSLDQDLGSLINIDMSRSWPDAAADLFPESQNIPQNASSRVNQSNPIAGGQHDISPLDEFPDEATLGQFNDWDDIEIYDRDQLRRNLGFLF